jgi:hypothetical protein
MTSRRSCILLFLVAVAASGCGAPRTPAPAAKPAPDAAPVVVEDLEFPRGWIGVWSGPLHITTPGKPKQTLAMELHIQPIEGDTGKWTFKIVYDKQPRDYVLIAKDLAQGELVVDEQNSIVIDARLVDDTLFSQFSVQGNYIQARYTRVAGAIDFEIVMTRLSSPTKTGGRDGVPEVDVFPVRVVQRARLTRAGR